MASAPCGWESKAKPLVSQVKQLSRRRGTASSGRPWGWPGNLPTWEMTQGGEEAAFQVSVWPSCTTGVLLGSREKRTPSH